MFNSTKIGKDIFTKEKLKHDGINRLCLNILPFNISIDLAVEFI